MPVLLDKVQVKNREGLYLVVRVDSARKVADVVNVAKANKRIANVSFSSIEPLEQ